MLPEETMVIACVSHLETANDILAQTVPGQNEFLTRPGASHYGIRKRYTVVAKLGSDRQEKED